jgi:hypothetical protein
MHMAETLTTPHALEAHTAQTGKMPGFEALYEVYGMDKLNLDGKLLMTSPLDSNTIWTSGNAAEVHANLPGRAADPVSH